VSDLSPLEARALDAVDSAAIAALLIELLAVPSVGGTDAECDIQHLLGKKVQALGMDVDLWPFDLPELQAADGFPGVEVERTEAWGLVGTLPGESAEPALVLQGHVDVVPSGDRARWSADPFEPVLRGTAVHGRGACDMKAGVVANLAALTAITRAGIRLRGGLALQFVVGEEDGGLGAFATLRRGHCGAAAIITEPTSGTLVTGNAGALTFTLTVPGVATHASTPYAGVSALDVYLPLHEALRDLQQERNRSPEPLMREYPVPYPVVVGRLRAGDWASSVPDLLVAEGRLGLRIEEDPDTARRALEQRISAAAAGDPFLRDCPPRVEWSGGQFAGGHLPAGSGLRDLVAAAHADTTGGQRLRERGAPYGSDLRLYAGAGVPTLHYGPGDVRLAHGPDEAVDVDEVVRVTRTLVLAALRACGVR
jgi:acetylornithine deacetylase